MIKPLYKNIVLKKAEAKTKTSSGIILSAAPQVQSNVAKIVAVGPACQSPLTVNDLVVFDTHKATSVTVDQETYLIIDESGILAVLTD